MLEWILRGLRQGPDHHPLPPRAGAPGSRLPRPLEVLDTDGAARELASGVPDRRDQRRRARRLTA